SLKVCSSVISLSISCTEVVVARCYRFATQLAMSGGDRTERRKAKAHEITKSCDYDFAADGHLGSRRALATVVGVLGFRGRHRTGISACTGALAVPVFGETIACSDAPAVSTGKKPSRHMARMIFSEGALAKCQWWQG